MKTPTFRAVRCLLAAAVSLAAVIACADNTVLSHVRIVTPGRDTVENGMIIVSGDKIAYVGPATSFEVGYTEVDCTGLTAYPGFIDAYTRTGANLPSAPEAPAAPSAVDGPLPMMWHENRRGVYADLDVSQYVDAKLLAARHSPGVTCVLLASGRGAFGGKSAVVATIEATPASVLLPAAFEELSLSGGGGGGYPGSPMARIAFIRQLLYDGRYALAHPQQDGTASDAVIDAIGDMATGISRTLFRADSEREIQRMLNLTDEFRLSTTLLGTDAAWQRAEDLNKRHISAIVQAAFPREPVTTATDDPVRRLNDPPQAYRDEQHAKWADDCLAVIKLQKAGVRFAFSSDGDTDLFLQNVRKQIDLGLPKDAALRALTVDAAAILGVSDKTGAIEVGKLADIVLMTGDFASADSKVKSVLVAGKKFDVAGAN